MIKITEESIKEHLISKDWKKHSKAFFLPEFYVSPDSRYKLMFTEFSNLVPEGEDGWILQIDDSRRCSLARGDVEYIEQIFALIDIYKDY
jgi:hypothetical protein